MSPLGGARGLTRPTVDVPQLYAQHWRSLVRLALLLVDDVPTAEDVVQNVFITLYRRQAALTDPVAALGYLRSGVVKGCRSVLRHRTVARRTLPKLVPPPDPSSALDVVLSRDSSVLAAVRELPARMQEVLVLRYWADLSEAEIAQALGISTGTVKSSASRGIDHVRRTLGGVR